VIRVLLLALFIGCASIGAQTKPRAVKLEISGDTVIVVRSFPCQVIAPPGADVYFWSYSDALKCRAIDNVLTITAAPNGTYTVSVTSLTVKIDFDKKTYEKIKDAGETTVVIGGVKPPDPPTPPDPPPPAPTGPLRVLMVYESAELPKMSEKQQQILYGRKVRDWLNAKCAPDGDRKAWRIWDKDTDASADEKHWQEYLKRPRASVPFLHVFRGDKVVHEGPLPEDAESALMLLERIEGGK
jgi:hypothetical protein